MKYFIYFSFFLLFSSNRCSPPDNTTNDNSITDGKGNKKTDTIVIKEKEYIVDNTRRSNLIDTAKIVKNSVKSEQSRLMTFLKKNKKSIFIEFTPQLKALSASIDTLIFKAERTDPIPTELYWQLSDSLAEYALQLMILSNNLDNGFQQKWQTKIYFKSGNYLFDSLDYSQKTNLNNFLNEIRNFCNTLIEKYPNRNWDIKIECVGYADQQGFKEKKKNELIKLGQLDNPYKREFSKEELNVILSEQRAIMVSSYIQEKLVLQNTSTSDSVIGMGEMDIPAINEPQGEGPATFEVEKQFEVKKQINKNNPEQRVVFISYYIISKARKK